MRTKIRGLLGLLLLLSFICPVLAEAAGTSVLTKGALTKGGWRDYVWTCTSDGDGAVTFSSASAARITGVIYSLEIGPGAAVSAGTVTLVSETGSAQDYLFGVGATFCTSAGTSCIRNPVSTDGYPPMVIGKSLAPEITGMGATKTVTITVRVKEE